ncbi:hypothetical protein B0H14DRAFT_3874917 [Mycena olivaceomarginata]|nr:hypothetical protein B0H14DRAFT_3874917 [Mycena olivaceomarginata]
METPPARTHRVSSCRAAPRASVLLHEGLLLLLPLQALLDLRHRLRQPSPTSASPPSSRASNHTDDPNSSPSLSYLEQQHLLLYERQQALLALHRRHLCSASPTWISTGIVPPACALSVLLSGSEGVDPLTFLPLSTPAPRAPLPFITTTRDSTGSSSAAFEMPALVATLLLRRWESKQTSVGARPTFMPRVSRLRVSSSMTSVSTSASAPCSHPIPTEPRVGLIDLCAPGGRHGGPGPLLRFLARPANSTPIERVSLISSPCLTARPPKLWLAFHHCTANPPHNATLRCSRHLTLYLQHRLGINHHIFPLRTTNSTHPHTHARNSMKRGAAATIHAFLLTNLTDLAHRTDTT